MHPRHTYIVLTILYNLGMSFTFTGYVPYLASIGLTPSDVSLVNMWFVIAGVAFELPTGVFADRVSRVWSVQLGLFIVAAGSLLYATAVGFWTALIYELVLGVGMAFISGALSAWIMDALCVRGEEQRFRETVSRGSQYQSLSVLLGGVAGGFIGEWSFRATWIVSAVIVSLAGVVAFRSMRDERPMLTLPAAAHRPLQQSWSLLRRGRGLVWAVAAAVAYGLVFSFNHYWAPYFDRLVGATTRTLLWVPMHVTVATGSWLVRRFLIREQQESSVVVVTLICTGAGLAALPQVSGMGSVVVCIMLHELGRGAFAPMLELFVQNRVKSEIRATYGSLQSFLTRIGYSAILGAVAWWAYGRVWDNTLTARLWTFSGCALVVLACVLWCVRPKVRAD
jgi:MFS family permease